MFIHCQKFAFSQYGYLYYKNYIIFLQNGYTFRLALSYYQAYTNVSLCCTACLALHVLVLNSLPCLTRACVEQLILPYTCLCGTACHDLHVFV
jgi:hypothetical protein